MIGSAISILVVRRGAIHMFAPFGHLSISQVFYHFKDFGPTWERTFIGPLVFVDGHDEFELLFAEFTFFGGSPRFRTPSSRTAPAFQATSAIYDVVSTLRCFGAVFFDGGSFLRGYGGNILAHNRNPLFRLKSRPVLILY